ncbi:MAG: glycosyltransferase family 2 protein [Acidimicrobiales bacterium]|nr:glycosyltransferase family 2 protein [Acidimicrobiales bacterium]
MRKIYAIIVDYGAGQDLLSLVRALGKETIDQVIVVDNGASDGLAPRAKDVLSPLQANVLVIESEINRGFGSGVNSAAVAIKDAKLGDFFLILNPDVVIDSSVIIGLAQVLDENGSCGLAGPKLVDENGDFYPSARKFPSVIDAFFHAMLHPFWSANPFSKRYMGRDYDPSLEEAMPVDWVSGACFMIRYEDFIRVGGFDERFFLYLEDVDLCFRLHEMARSILWCPYLKVQHKGGGTTKIANLRSISAHHNSAIAYERKNARGFRKCLLPMAVIVLRLRQGITLLARWWKKSS